MTGSVSRRTWLAGLGLCAPLTAVAPIRQFQHRAMAATTAVPTPPPIVLGLVWSEDAKGKLAEGVHLACDEINRNDGVNGRQIELVRREIDLTLKDPRSAAIEVARDLCKRGDLLAVIGHHNAAEAIPAAITYDQNGLIFLNPTITNGALNDSGFQRTFTTLPTDSMIAQQIASFAFGLGYRRFIVLRSREDFAQDVAIAFADQVARLGMTIVDEHSFTAHHTDFQDIVANLGAQQFDALLIAARWSQAAALIRQSYTLRLDSPFLIGEFVSPQAMASALGKSAAPVAGPILFNPKSDFPSAVIFNQRFKDRYGIEPDDWAAQGYDAVQLLAIALKSADGADSSSVATVMRYSLSWRGVTGRYSFDRAGRVYTKQLKFAMMDQGEIRYDDVDE